MTVLTTLKVSQNFRITLPREVREYLKLEEGNELVFFTTEGFQGRICIRKS